MCKALASMKVSFGVNEGFFQLALEESEPRGNQDSKQGQGHIEDHEDLETSLIRSSSIQVEFNFSLILLCVALFVDC